MEKWSCKICGYIAMANETPNICPICKTKGKFKKIDGEMLQSYTSNTLTNSKKWEFEEIEYHITSATYFQKEIEKLVDKISPINNRYLTEQFSETNMVVWKYDQCKIKNVRFEKDPKNKHDPNAIKIIAGTKMLDMTQIGYIPQSENAKFKSLLDKKRIYNINLIIYGGEKKIIAKNNTINEKEDYKVILRILIKK